MFRILKVLYHLVRIALVLFTGDNRRRKKARENIETTGGRYRFEDEPAPDPDVEEARRERATTGSRGFFRSTGFVIAAIALALVLTAGLAYLATSLRSGAEEMERKQQAEIAAQKEAAAKRKAAALRKAAEESSEKADAVESKAEAETKEAERKAAEKAAEDAKPKRSGVRNAIIIAVLAGLIFLIWKSGVIAWLGRKGAWKWMYANAVKPRLESTAKSTVLTNMLKSFIALLILHILLVLLFSWPPYYYGQFSFTTWWWAIFLILFIFIFIRLQKDKEATGYYRALFFLLALALVMYWSRGCSAGVAKKAIATETGAAAPAKELAVVVPDDAAPPLDECKLRPEAIAELNKIEDIERRDFLAAIACCVSCDGQFDENGKVVMTELPDGDVAVGQLQIRATVWEKYDPDSDFDIRTWEGNFAFADYLLESLGPEGRELWADIKDCWQKRLKAPKPPAFPVSRFEIAIPEQGWTPDFKIPEGRCFKFKELTSAKYTAIANFGTMAEKWYDIDPADPATASPMLGLRTLTVRFGTKEAKRVPIVMLTWKMNPDGTCPALP